MPIDHSRSTAAESIFRPGPVLSLCLMLILAGCSGSDSGSGSNPFQEILDAGALDTGDSLDANQDTAPGPDIRIDEAADLEPSAPPEICDEDGEICDDSNPCTHSTSCLDGECVGESYTCSDDIPCTHDLCDGFGGCTYPIREDSCLIDGKCHEDNAHNELTECLSCIPPLSNTEWSEDDTRECDDGDYCTGTDRCVAGACLGLAVLPCEDDGNICTDSACDPACGCGVRWDDEQGKCVPAHNERYCDDGDACTAEDICQNGWCSPGPKQVACNDNNPCTTDAPCDPELGCVHSNSVGPCDDGNECTLYDSCSSGVCVSGIQPLPCDDGNGCTDDVCDPINGCLYLPNTDPCDDGNRCTMGDQCTYGGCLAGIGFANCNDGNPCTENSCDPVIGCIDNNLSGYCDDGDPCTVGDFCTGGSCASGGVVVNCDDNNPCTNEGCDAITGECIYTNNIQPCDDDNVCTLFDRCKEGLCQPGTGSLACEDDNPCTQSGCDPITGCFQEPAANTCTDNNACTLGDLCVGGVCASGNTMAVCTDENPCTQNFCDPVLGCQANNNDGFACDDGNPCSQEDTCAGGLCIGSESPCDDENDCTQDFCLADGGCEHVLLDTPVCKPDIVVTFPPRGAMIQGPPDSVTTTGSVTSLGGEITAFSINEEPVTVNPDGSFSHAITPRVGTNIIRYIANNKAGGTYKAVRAFQYSHKFYPADPSNPEAAQIPDGLQIYLGKTLFDNNTPAPDDFASLILYAIGGLSLESLIPSPLAQTGVLQCTAKIYAKNISYNGPELDLYPINGGMHVQVRLTNVYMKIEADLSGFLCPSASGDVTANAITVDADLLVSVPTPGNPVVTLANQQSNIQGLNIDLDGVLGFFVNWLVNFFEGTIASELESTIAGQLESFAPQLANILASLAIEYPISLPPLIGSGSNVDVMLKGDITKAEFDTFGGTIGLTTSVLTDKGIAYDPLGSISRKKCLIPGASDFNFVELNAIEIGLSDDLMNQLLYALWYGGSLDFVLGENDLPQGSISSDFGIENLVVDVSFMLPPVVTDCTPGGLFKIQLGDVRIKASLSLLGQPIEAVAYASAEGNMLVNVENTPTGPGLSFGFGVMDVTEIEIETGAGGVDVKYALLGIIESSLLPILFESLGSGSLATVPIPSFDLGSVAGGSLPPGATFAIQAEEVYRRLGFWVVSGNIE